MFGSMLDRRAQLFGLLAAAAGGAIVHLIYAGAAVQLGPLEPIAQQLFGSIFLFVCLVLPGFTVAQLARESEIANTAVFGALFSGLVVLLAVTALDVRSAPALGALAAVTMTCTLAGGVLGSGLRRSFPDSLNG